jgi:uncharacterized protein (DUF305 family)
MTTLKLLAACGALAASLVLGGCGSDMGRMSPSPSTSSAPSSSSSPAPAGAAHNDGDVAFASMMIPHHNQAIEMSDTLLAKSGIDPKITALAKKIKAAQGPEVAQMSGWLASWGENPSPSSTGGMGGMGGMNHGDGTMSHADMGALKSATGNSAAQLFLTGMIKHHQGAVGMAQTELDQGQDPDAKKLAQDIIRTQKAEITTMNQLLGT